MEEEGVDWRTYSYDRGGVEGYVKDWVEGE